MSAISWRPGETRSGSATCESRAGGELRRRGGVEASRATELPDDEKPRIIEAYLTRWDYQVKRYFETLPQPATHPVFRINRP